MKQGKAPDIKQLTDAIVAAESKSGEYLLSVNKWKGLADEREKIASDLRSKNDDLKKRLSEAEQENQRMRGYIQRVQEDDTVREELVAIGDPSGEQQLVPKRKRTEFPSPNQYTDFGRDDGPFAYHRSDSDRRAKTKHWVTY